MYNNPLLTKKDSPYAQFHAKQGMVLFGAWVLTLVIEQFSYGLGQLIYLVIGIFSIWGIINVLQNKSVRLPVVADLGDKIFK